MSAASDADRVRVICGPTAAGKSRIAMQLALRFGARIISADSRQVYRGFDIGTAKPALNERETVPHYCIDVAAPEVRYSAAQWAEQAQLAITECIASGAVPLVVGGTGFYLRALFTPLFREPEIDPARRRAVEQELELLPLEKLRHWCEKLDPARAHLGRTQLLRAIEVALLTGQRLSVLHEREKRPAQWQPSYLLVDPGTGLSPGIERRVHEMIEQGWRDEVAQLDQVVPADAPAWKSTGYRTMREVVRGKISLQSAREEITILTRQYAKRQRTWFRHQLDRPALTVSGAVEDDDRMMAWWDHREVAATG